MSDDSAVQADAERQLTAIGLPAVPALANTLLRKGGLRAEAAKILHAIGEEKIMQGCMADMNAGSLDTRRRAAVALSVMTHYDLGYDPNASPQEREWSVARWQDWWTKNKATFRFGG